ncbi:class I adenylate-forming enzyme family protein [Nocardia carnea]|uniref:class I adenylate-forming enzyme family protein n=1 Tax=Nocardia carnea TaxID=37328 RepID=UPI002454034D|nr:AMP-binding protein [Nocardia carnea]
MTHSTGLSPGEADSPFGSLVPRYGELVERRAERQPERVAIVHEDRCWTYGRLRERIHAIAQFLTRHGVGPGDRVVCFSENRPEVLAALYACSRIGAVFAPVGIAATVEELTHVLDDLDARVLLVSGETAGRLTPSDGRAIASYLLAPSTGTSLEAVPDTAETVAPAHRPGPEDPVLIVYTSGTSGRPKGVVLGHRALWFNSLNTLMGLDIVSDDVTLVNTPLSHTAALNTLAISTLHKGGTVVLDRGFDASRCLDQIRRHRVTTMFAVPSMLALMAQDGGFDQADLSSLRWVLGGGAPMSPALVATWSGRGVPVLASFGMTEAGPSVSFRRPDEAAGKPGSSGAPALLTDLRIVSAQGIDCAVGTVGDVWVRGPHLASGYWRNSEATAAAFAGGWLKTGDRGYLDQDGDLCITGRSKDTIITGGENVDPAEVEHLIAQLPGVRDAAVVGRPHPVWGEVVTAVLVTDAEVTVEDLQRFLRPHLAKFKIPRAVETRSELPRSAVGKLLRQELAVQNTDNP